MMRGAKRVVLIGDPKQLPATIFSQKCLNYKYDQSLFERFMKADFPINVLTTQYRMQPEISHIIGNTFYSNMLKNSEDIKIYKPNLIPKSFVMFHIDNGYEIFTEKSYRNPTEAYCV